MAAGALLVQEAGGVVVDPTPGKDFDLMSRRILVASTQQLVEDWTTQIEFKTDDYPRDYPDEIKSLN